MPQYGTFEERVTTWQAASHDEAINRAEVEARQYAPGGDQGVYTGYCESFEMFDDPGDGAEVFSLIRESVLDADSYINRFFDTGAER